MHEPVTIETQGEIRNKKHVDLIHKMRVLSSFRAGELSSQSLTPTGKCS